MGAKGDQVKGRAEEAIGGLIGDKDLESEGKADRRAGESKEKLEHARDEIEKVIDKTKHTVEKVIDKARSVAYRK